MCVSEAGGGSREELELPFSPAVLLFSNVQRNNNQIEKKKNFKKSSTKVVLLTCSQKTWKILAKTFVFSKVAAIIHTTLLKSALLYKDFSKDFTISAEQSFYFSEKLFLRTFLNGCFSKTAAILNSHGVAYFTFL